MVWKLSVGRSIMALFFVGLLTVIILPFSEYGSLLFSLILIVMFNVLLVCSNYGRNGLRLLVLALCSLFCYVVLKDNKTVIVLQSFKHYCLWHWVRFVCCWFCTVCPKFHKSSFPAKWICKLTQSSSYYGVVN